MGAIAKRNCPHCKTRDVAFTAVMEWQEGGGGGRALFLCGACGEGVIWEWWGASRPSGSSGLIDNLSISLGRQWPEPVSGNAPEDTPPTVANYFQQGTSSLEVGNFDAAGVKVCKCLENTTKIMSDELSMQPLIKRIDALAKAGRLTEDLASWAHEIRIGGNEAAHEDEPFTFDQALDLRNFIENFLRYAFTLPSTVQKRIRPGQSIS